MRLQSIRIRNLGPFRDAAVDLSTIPEAAKIVAVCGANGQGKSTLLELWTGGALYRECRTRGSLASLATSRDASLDVRLENGKPWTIRHLVDSVSGKGESVALDASGEPVTKSGRVSAFDAWSASHLPSPEILYSSMVACQQSPGFLEQKPSDRKGLLLRLLGVERLEDLAKTARDLAREEGVKAGALRARIRDEAERADVAAGEAELAEARQRAESAGTALANAQQDLDVARELAGSSALARKRYEEQAAALRELLDRRDAAAKTVEDLERRIANNRAVLAQADEIRAACERREEIGAEINGLAMRATEAKAKAESARREHQSLTAQLNDTRESRRAAGHRIEQLRIALARAPEIEAAAKELPAAMAAAAESEALVRSLETKLEELRGTQLAGAEQRIGTLRGGLDQIRLDAKSGLVGSDLGLIAADTLAEDNEIQTRAAEHPAKLQAATEALRQARVKLSESQARAQKVSGLAEQAGRLEEDRTALAAAQAELQRIAEREAGLTRACNPMRDSASAHAAAADGLMAAQRPLNEELDRLRPLCAKEQPLQTAEARLAELEPQEQRIRAELADLDRRIIATPEPAPPEQAPDVARLEAALRAARSAHESAVSAVGAAEGRLDAAHEAQLHAEELRVELAAVDTEQADWTRLGIDLGRDGLQAALIDSAGPELTAVTNDLLHQCVSTRWTVSIETQRASADGKKTIEGLDVRVIDSHAGRDTTVETLSGGERALVGEALSLALTTLACRRAGLERPTIVRDETAAALDETNAGSYVAMLRRAATQIGADRVLVVSHDPRVSEACDAMIEVRNGEARIA